MKKYILTILIFMLLAPAIGRAANEPYISDKLDIRDQGESFEWTIHQADTPLIRVYLYNNGERWQPTTNDTGVLVFGTNDIYSTNLVMVMGTANPTSNYVDFQFTGADCNTSGTFFAQVAVSNSVTSRTFVFQDGDLIINRNPFAAVAGNISLITFPTNRVHGDMVFYNTNVGQWVTLNIGTSGQRMQVSGGLPAWKSSGPGNTNNVTNLVGGTDIDATLSGLQSWTIDHSDTSSQAGVTNTGQSVFYTMSLDGRGHLTDIGSTNLGLVFYTIAQGNASSNDFAATNAIFTTGKTDVVTFNILDAAYLATSQAFDVLDASYLITSGNVNTVSNDLDTLEAEMLAGPSEINLVKRYNSFGVFQQAYTSDFYTAINTADHGDYIGFGPGWYVQDNYQGILSPPTNVTIFGAGPEATTIYDNDDQVIAFSALTGTNKLVNLTVLSTDNYPIYLDRNSAAKAILEIHNCKIHRLDETPQAIYSSYQASSTCRVYNSWVYCIWTNIPTTAYNSHIVADGTNSRAHITFFPLIDDKQLSLNVAQYNSNGVWSAPQSLTNDANIIAGDALNITNTPMSDLVNGLSAGDSRPAFAFSSDGSIVTCVVSNTNGTATLDYYFDELLVQYDVPSNIILTAAADDTAGQENWIYATPAGITNATSRPSGERAILAHVVLLSAGHTQTNNGPFGVQRYTEMVGGPDKRSRISHIGERIRTLGSLWESGLALSVTTNVNGGAEDDMFLTYTAGTAWQMHLQSFAALTNVTGAQEYHILNDNGDITHITNLNEIANDANGNAVLAGPTSHFNIEIVKYIASGTTNNIDLQIGILLSTDDYSTAAGAAADSLNQSVVSVDNIYRCCVIRLARVTLNRTAAGGGTWSALVTDRRGQPLGSASGGSGSSAASTEFQDTLFRVFDQGDSTKRVAFEVSGISGSTTREWTVPNEDIDFGAFPWDNITGDKITITWNDQYPSNTGPANIYSAGPFDFNFNITNFVTANLGVTNIFTFGQSISGALTEYDVQLEGIGAGTNRQSIPFDGVYTNGNVLIFECTNGSSTGLMLTIQGER